MVRLFLLVLDIQSAHLSQIHIAHLFEHGVHIVRSDLPVQADGQVPQSVAVLGLIVVDIGPVALRQQRQKLVGIGFKYVLAVQVRAQLAVAPPKN